MSSKGDRRDSRIYAIIAVFILIVIIFAVVFGSNQLKSAYVPDEYLLIDGWSENPEDRDSGSRLFGLEKWCSLTYEIEGNYPAYFTVTTIKTLVIMNENELEDETIETIENAMQQGVIINKSTEFTGERTLKNNHKTKYIIYDGEDIAKNPSEKVKVIGEVWNCGNSGTSIICIGVAQVTDNANNNSKENTANWDKIIKDELGSINGLPGKNGLIYNVKCHD